MKFWYATFEGEWPVGAVAVAVAGTKEDAQAAINKELIGEGFKPVELGDVNEIDIPSNTPGARILLRGTY